jgi:hypothetical protein
MCGISCVENLPKTEVINGIEVHPTWATFGNVIIPRKAIDTVGYGYMYKEFLRDVMLSLSCPNIYIGFTGIDRFICCGYDASNPVLYISIFCGVIATSLQETYHTYTCFQSAILKIAPLVKSCLAIYVNHVCNI